ncbi:MAG: molybdopterin-dependent oxidoreductase, partial [Nitrospirota bacterium]
HGDQNPAHPFWSGVQTSDNDHSDMRFAKLHTSWGKNFLEHKMPEAHWMIECMERGGRLVTIAPEYNPPATKSDYWIPVRPQSDGALMLGTIKILFDENMYDADFCKQFTDMPILVRTDTLTYLEPKDVIKDYKLADLSKSYSYKVQAMKDPQRERLGDFMVWDTAKNAAVPMHRELVGYHLTKAGIDPALEGVYRVTLLDGKTVDVMPIFQMYKVHVQDFDLDTTHQITNSPKDLIVRWARDCGTVKPHQLHNGEGTNHWFHQTAQSRGAAMVVIVTGNVGKFGAGQYTWAGNFKAGMCQGTPWSGPGLGVWGAEDPWAMNLDPNAHGKEIKVKSYRYGQEPSYWNHGDRALVVNTPKY